MEYVGWTALGLMCVTLFWLPGYLLNKRDANRLVQETEGMHVRRKREDLLYEYAICVTDIPRGDPRWFLMLNRAEEVDKEVRKMFPNEEIQYLAPIVRQWTLIPSARFEIAP